MKTEKYTVTGMTCAACQANVTRCVEKLKGTVNVDVSLLANQMTVTYDDNQLNSQQIMEAVQEIGYGAVPVKRTTEDKQGFRGEWQNRQKHADEEQKQMRKRLITSIILLIPLMYLAMGSMMSWPLPEIFLGMENSLISALTQLLITIPVLFVNRHFYQNGFKALLHRAPNMDSLVAVGSGASLLYGIFAIYRMAYGFGHGQMTLVHEYAHALYFESAAMIVTLVTVGKYLEARSKAKTSDALGKLVDLAPKTASVIRNGVEQIIPAEQVVAGDLVIIRPGQGIPVDGIVEEGHGYVDQAVITGESIPVEKQAGDSVISATINKNGTFRFRASRVGEDTTLAQIIRLVDEAGNSKAPIARLADQVSGVFVPIVMGISLLTIIVWLLVGWDFEFALSNAISVLVISCPCALGLATPVAIMVGTGKAAEMGILIKSAESLEMLHKVDTVVLDKTGTITSGHPTVTNIIPLDGTPESIFLQNAASVEAGSEHPLAQAIVERARQEGVILLDATDFTAIVGRGVTATVNGALWAAGNMDFMREKGSCNQGRKAEIIEEQIRRLAQEGKTPLLFAKEGEIVGIIAVADVVRASSCVAINRLTEMGLKVVMLTGDNQITAEAIRRETGISEAIADVLPTEKEAHVRILQQQGRRVAMVGDGVNDAPALARANIGIAIGAGTDVAIDSADVVLMKNSLEDVVTAIELSRSVVRNIHMNLFWAFFYNVLGIPLAAGVFYPAFQLRLSPMIGSAAMSLSSVCVVANALRLRFFKKKDLKKSSQSQVLAADCETSNCSLVPELENMEERKGENEMKKIVLVEGMMCAHCQMHVEKALSAVDGVKNVQVDLEKKRATVLLEKEVSDEALLMAVQDAGYTPVGCVNE